MSSGYKFKNDSESSGGPAPSRPLPQIGECVDRFEIRSLLGEGGFGTVFRAYDPYLERDVAIKIPCSQFWVESQEREILLEEARAAALLTHPSVCPIYEVGEEGGRPYIVMAWIDGLPLSHWIAAGDVWEEHAINLLIRQVAVTMDEAHRSGAVHRDLKPANILIDNRRNPILTDFGLARRTLAGTQRDGFAKYRVGTPCYMSPEQVRQDVVGPASDIFSLGVIYYELLTGQRPFTGETRDVLEQILAAEPPLPSSIRPDLNPQSESICLKALQKNPNDRFASMGEMAEALGEVLKSATPGELLSHAEIAMPAVSLPASSAEDATETLRDFPQRRSRRRPPMIWMAILAVAAGVAGGLYFADRERVGRLEREGERLPAAVASADVEVGKWLAAMHAPFDAVWEGRQVAVRRLDELPAGPIQIVHIDLSQRPALLDQDLANLSALKSLESLWVRDSPITDAALAHLRPLKSLKVLWIDRTRVTDAGLALIKDLPNLESLSLNDTKVTGDGMRHFAAHPKLQRLALKRAAVDDAGMEGLGELESLTHLWLDGTSLTDNGLRALAGLENLTELMIADANIDGSGLRRLSGLPNLSQLALKRTRLRCEAMRDLGSFPALTHFYADSTSLGNEGLKALIDAAPRLTRLSIGHTRVSSAGLEHLAKLRDLEILSLDMLRLKQNSLEHLAALPKLKSLSIRFTQIGDQHASALTQLTQLQQIYVGGTRLTAEAREQLASALPNCQIQ